MNSDDLNEGYNKTGNEKIEIAKPEPIVKPPTKNAVDKINLGSAHGKYLERKQNFDKQFEQTLENFSLNIDFLVHQ